MPNIEVIITTQEETTMLSITINKEINHEVTNENCYKLSISGLIGGHSGDDIDKNRCNAIKLAVRLLKKLNYKSIADINFGKRDNVIPSEGYVVFSSKENIKSINEKIGKIDFNLNDEEHSLDLKIENYEDKTVIKESKEVVEFISKIKNGLLEVYENDGFPLLSANIGKISVEGNKIEIKYSIRSSDLLKEEELLKEIIVLSSKYGFELTVDANKPFFPYKDKSIIRNILTENYKELYDKETTIKKVHACMEGGILSNKIQDLDICTIAPTIENCHSINERVSITSTKRVYEWLKQTLIQYNQ